MKVVISPESLGFLAGVKARKEAAQIEYDRLEKENEFLKSEDPFKYSGGARTQAYVIIEQLSKTGFFDNMSDEEVQEKENLLISMTYGMNSIRGSAGSSLNQFSQLSSAAARFELESSTAALKQFSKKHIPEEMQKDFNSLIDKYYEHNTKALVGYKSEQESTNEFTAKLYERTSAYRITPLTEEEKISLIASKVKPTKADEDAVVEEWKACFEELVNGQSTVNSAIDEMSNALKKYASGNSQNNNFVKYVEQWNAFSIENARSYWAKLI